MCKYNNVWIYPFNGKRMKCQGCHSLALLQVSLKVPKGHRSRSILLCDCGTLSLKGCCHMIFLSHRWSVFNKETLSFSGQHMSVWTSWKYFPPICLTWYKVKKKREKKLLIKRRILFWPWNRSSTKRMRERKR